MEAPNQAAAETIRIYVRPLYHDAILRLDVEGSDTIESVKEKIQAWRGSPRSTNASSVVARTSRTAALSPTAMSRMGRSCLLSPAE
jgi:hypothetical protein